MLSSTSDSKIPEVNRWFEGWWSRKFLGVFWGSKEFPEKLVVEMKRGGHSRSPDVPFWEGESAESSAGCSMLTTVLFRTGSPIPEISPFGREGEGGVG